MTTWYVRPDTSHSATRNGTSYATAWGGWSAITWGAGGVVGGDTLYVCGTHSIASTISVGNHGASSNSARVTISGEYTIDPGYFVVTGTGNQFLATNRSYTNFVGLTFTGYQSVCLYLSATQSNVTIQRCVFNPGTSHMISMAAGSSYVFTDILIDSCTFSGDCRNGSNATGAINWFASTAAASNLVRVSVTNNIFKDLITGRAAIHFRAQSDSDASTTMTDIRVENNTFLRVYGVCIEVNNGFSTVNKSSGLKIYNNTFKDCSVIPASILGGCMSVWGFGPSSTLGIPTISYNTARNCTGPAGFADLFFGTYKIHHNYAEDLYTDTIDANGVLFDYGNVYGDVYSNTFKNLLGKSGVNNSGCGIMVLDSTNITCHSNIIDNCLTGVFFGAASSVYSTGQSSTVINNTILNCKVQAVYVHTSADKGTTVVKNNLFTAENTASVSVTNVGATWTNGDSYNCFYNFAEASNHTLSVTNLTSNPLITTEAVIRASSPLIEAGVFSSYINDFSGQQFNNPPTIGAYEYIPIRGDAGTRGTR